MDEKQARHLEVHTKWNGKANVCVHCGRVPETFYIVTGHDHTDYDIRWCPCREPNHNWCAGCSPDNCSGCGAGPVAEVVWFDPALRYEPEKAGKIIDGSIAFMESAPLGTKLYTTPQPDRVAELEAALKVARDALDHARLFIRNGIGLGYIRMPDDDCPDPAKSVPGEIFEALAKINEVLHD